MTPCVIFHFWCNCSVKLSKTTFWNGGALQLQKIKLKNIGYTIFIEFPAIVVGIMRTLETIRDCLKDVLLAL